MSNITKIVGQRIRNYRTEQNLSQEKLAEISGCHPTYIGQVERGEKNATIESIEKIASALHISLETLFMKLGTEDNADNIPLRCYELIASEKTEEQKQLYDLLLRIVQYKNH